jgi:RNA polymerase sigma factor (sigma-70 family)
MTKVQQLCLKFISKYAIILLIKRDRVLEIAQEKIDLISKIIKNDRKYPNNEDLFDDFLNETCKRSVSILDAIDSDATLKTCLKRVVTTAIINVLKDSGRLRRTHDTYVATKEVPLSEPEPSYSNTYNDIRIEYEPVDFDNGPEDVAIKKEVLSLVLDSLNNINSQEPDKQYFDLYRLRYKEGMTQSEIARELNLSQSEVSKRLFKLMHKIKTSING